MCLFSRGILAIAFFKYSAVEERDQVDSPSADIVDIVEHAVELACFDSVTGEDIERVSVVIVVGTHRASPVVAEVYSPGFTQG